MDNGGGRVNASFAVGSLCDGLMCVGALAGQRVGLAYITQEWELPQYIRLPKRGCYVLD